MCEICEKVKTIDFFPTPKVYLDCIKYIQSLVDGGSFQFESKEYDTNKVINENGYWVDDIICHIIKCKNCGQCFSCDVVTYRGCGSFRKEK